MPWTYTDIPQKEVDAYTAAKRIVKEWMQRNLVYDADRDIYMESIWRAKDTK
jgi:hypothetical protein